MRLYFMPLEGDRPGQRVFDVKLQGQTVLQSFDPAAKAGAFVHELRDIAVTDNLVVEMIPAKDGADAQPVLSAIEVVRRDAREITEQVAAR